MMKPNTEAALAEAIGSARGPLRIEGGGSGALPASGERLSVAGLTGITLYEPGALTVVVKAGTPLEELKATLASEGQRLAFEPPDYRGMLHTSGVPTIGAVIASNASGARRIMGGAARDYALGVRFVDGAGRLVKNGGRVMKNVTGYDLVKLMCGSFGTLGVLTEVSLKVLPIPECSATLMLRDLDERTAIDAMALALRSPYEVSGAAHCAKILDDRPVTALRVEGFQQSVRYRIGKLKELLAGFGAIMETAPQEMSDWFWQGVTDATGLVEREGDVWRVSCRASQAADLAARSGAEGWFFDWGGARIWFRMQPGTDLRARLGHFDGHATLMRASDATRPRLGTFHPEAPGIARLTAGLRARFDPRGILNPGLMASAPDRETA